MNKCQEPRWCGCEFNNVPCSHFNEYGDTEYCCVCGHPEICHMTNQGYIGQEPHDIDDSQEKI